MQLRLRKRKMRVNVKAPRRQDNSCPLLFLQGLRELVIKFGSQTQATLASISSSLQNINAEMVSLREQIRRPALKKRKVCMLVSMQKCNLPHSVLHHCLGLTF